jgi:hypothetical protein
MLVFETTGGVTVTAGSRTLLPLLFQATIAFSFTLPEHWLFAKTTMTVGRGSERERERAGME